MPKNGDLEASASRGLSNPELQLGYLLRNPLYAAFCPSRVKKTGQGEKGKELSRSLPREGCIAAFLLWKGKGNDSRLYSTRPAANAMHYTRSKVPAQMSRRQRKGFVTELAVLMISPEKQPKIKRSLAKHPKTKRN
jgi:hypothetical protein